MPTGSVVDYQVLQDGNVELDASNQVVEISRNISSPGDIELSRQAILSFKVRPLKNSDLSVIINGRPIFKTSFDASTVKVYWEVISWNEIVPSGSTISNPFTCRFVVENGHLRLADIVWWYQVKK
jgi:hypothetical protein